MANGWHESDWSPVLNGVDSPCDTCHNTIPEGQWVEAVEYQNSTDTADRVMMIICHDCSEKLGETGDI